MFDLKLSNDELKAFALILVVIVLYLLIITLNMERRCVKSGEEDLTKYLLLVHPDIHVSSKGAFSNVTPKVSKSCKHIESDIKVLASIWSMILKLMSFQIILNYRCKRTVICFGCRLCSEKRVDLAFLAFSIQYHI